MSLEVGTVYLCHTKTELYGTCMWKVLEVGLPAPESWREGEMDGIYAELISGTGPSVQVGKKMKDSEARIAHDISKGVIKIIEGVDTSVMVKRCAKRSVLDVPRHSGTGVVDI
jgi:hypothetical protein